MEVKNNRRKTKLLESIDLAVQLNIDTRKQGQALRGKKSESKREINQNYFVYIYIHVYIYRNYISSPWYWKETDHCSFCNW